MIYYDFCIASPQYSLMASIISWKLMSHSRWMKKLKIVWHLQQDWKKTDNLPIMTLEISNRSNFVLFYLCCEMLYKCFKGTSQKHRVQSKNAHLCVCVCFAAVLCVCCLIVKVVSYTLIRMDTWTLTGIIGSFLMLFNIHITLMLQICTHTDIAHLHLLLPTINLNHLQKHYCRSFFLRTTGTWIVTNYLYHTYSDD